jgi:hypothetical protein
VVHTRQGQNNTQQRKTAHNRKVKYRTSQNIVTRAVENCKCKKGQCRTAHYTIRKNKTLQNIAFSIARVAMPQRTQQNKTVKENNKTEHNKTLTT